MPITSQDLQNRIDLLQQELTDQHQRKWGQMQAQHMVEHLGAVLIGSTGIREVPMAKSPEKASQWKASFFSKERPFPKGVLMPGTKEGQAPPPLRFANMEEAKAALAKAYQKFIAHYGQHPDSTATHPYFGALTKEEWVHFHTKHFEHHLRQFGVLEE